MIANAPKDHRVKLISPLILILCVTSGAVEVVLNYLEIENKVLSVHPILKEKKFKIEQKELELRSLEMAALLPKFEVIASPLRIGYNNSRKSTNL